MCELVDVISRETDAINQVDTAYLDFQKALDRVDDILLQKLEIMRFVPQLLKLFVDYLKNWKHFVKHGTI